MQIFIGLFMLIGYFMIWLNHHSSNVFFIGYYLLQTIVLYILFHIFYQLNMFSHVKYFIFSFLVIFLIAGGMRHLLTLALDDYNTLYSKPRFKSKPVKLFILIVKIIVNGITLISLGSVMFNTSSNFISVFLKNCISKSYGIFEYSNILYILISSIMIVYFCNKVIDYIRYIWINTIGGTSIRIRSKVIAFISIIIFLILVMTYP